MIHFKSNLYSLSILLLILITGCVNEQFDDSNKSDDIVFVTFRPKDLVSEDQSLASGFRVIVFNSSGSLEFNKTQDELTHTSGGRYKMAIRPGCYTLYTVANLPQELTPELQAIRSAAELDALRLNYTTGITDSQIPVVWKKVIFVRSTGKELTQGQISFNNEQWQDTLNISMERAFAKITVDCKNENPNETVMIQGIALENLPAFSGLQPLAYPLSDKLLSIDKDFSAQPLPVGNSGTVVLSGQVIPENIPATSERRTILSMRFSNGGYNFEASFPIDEVKRNCFYQFDITVKGSIAKIESLTVLPWNDNSSDGNIPGGEISFSGLNVPYSLYSSSKIFFTTKNIPQSAVSLSDVFIGSGLQIGTKFDMTQTKIDYTYNPDTRTGYGSLNIKRNKASMMPDSLVVSAAGLKRIISVNGMGIAGSNIYWDAAQNRLTFDDTPFPGQRAPHEKYQGVSFYWGGLQAIPGGSQNSGDSQVMDYVWSSTGDTRMNAPVCVTNYLDLVNRKFPFKPDDGLGDICLFMTRRGWAPKNKKWRMPQRDELNKILPVVQEGRYLNNNPGYQPGYTLDGTSPVETGLRLGNYYLPQSGYFHRYGPGLGFNSQVCGNSFYATEDIPKGQYAMSEFYSLRKGSISNNYTNHYDFGLFVRCVVDETPGDIIPLYMVSYDLSDKGSGTITAPTSSGIITNQYADQGGSVVLSSVQLPSTNGLSHVGWIADGRKYAFGATLSGINKDVVVAPAWEEHVIAGTVWAATNLMASKQFAPSPAYSSTEGFGNYFCWNALTPDDITSYPSYDPQRDPCPDGWRMPTKTEVGLLVGFNNQGALIFAGEYDNVKGYWFGIDRQPTPEEYSKYLFIKLSGYRFNGSYDSMGWLYIPVKEDSPNQKRNVFNALWPSTFALNTGMAKNLGTPVRCVKQ